MRSIKQHLSHPNLKENGSAIWRKTIPFLISLLFSMSLSAQGEQASSGLMRSGLKIYVVVAVLLIIFAGIVVFLFSLEKRLKKLEEISK